MTPSRPAPQDLAPCPFCCGAASIHKETLDERYAYANKVQVQCNACGVAISAVGDTSKTGYADNSTTEHRAIAAWNRRGSSTSTSQTATAPELGKIVAANRDAARYRFMRSEATGDFLRFCPYGRPDEIDRKIDAAIAASTAQGEEE